MSFHRILSGLIITCAVVFQSTAQVPLFNKTYDDYNAWEVVRDIHENTDSTILVSSSTIDFFASDSTKYRRLYFSLLSQNGELINKKILTFTGLELGNSYKLGVFNNRLLNTVSYSDIDTNAIIKYLAKGLYVNSTGDTDKTFNIGLKAFDNCKPVFGPMVNTTNGTFVTIATYNNTYADSVYIFSSDTNENILWVKQHPDLKMYIRTIVETPDGGFILSGKQFKEGKYVPNPYDIGDMWVGHPERLWYAKIDSVGNLVWQKLLTGGYYELYDTIYYKYDLDTKSTFRSAIKTADGNYVLAGYIDVNPYMTKINEQGERLWQSKYFKNLTYLDTLQRHGYFYDIKEVDGYIYALGSIDSLLPNTTDDVPFYFLMKLTGTGRTVWTRYFPVTGSDYLYSVTPCKGGFFLTGSKVDTTPNKYGNQDGWIMKVDEYGCLIPGCQLNDVIDTLTAISEVTKFKPSYALFPNPATSTLNIRFETESKNTTYTIYNYSGQQMLSGKLTSSSAVNIQSLPTGLYIIEVRDEAGFLERQKFLKE